MILKKTPRIFAIAILSAAALFTSKPAKAKKKIETTVYMTVHDQKKIPISVNDDCFAAKSSNPNVLQFTPSGKMTAVKKGTVTVTLKYFSGEQTICKHFEVKVHDKVKNLKWKKSLDKLDINKSYRFEVTYKAASKKNIEFEWKSSNPKIASVDKNGKVTGHKSDCVTITCSVKGQKNTKVKYKLNIVCPPISKIRLDKSIYTMKKGQQFDIRSILHIAPSNAEKSSWKATSGNKNIVNLSNGVLKAKSVGRTNIKITSKANPEISATLLVQVNSKSAIDNMHCIAHRGFSKEAPENTVKAFELAGKAGFYSAESDVRLTKDGKFVIFHDATLSRLCNVDKNVKDLSYKEIRKIPIISGSNYNSYKNDKSATTIASLTEYLEVCKRYNMVPQIEIKFIAENSEQDNTDALYRLYTETRKVMKNQPIMFIGRNFNSLVYLDNLMKSKHDSNCKLYRLVSTVDSIHQIPHYDEIKKKGFGLDIKRLSDKKVFLQALKDGIELNVWTVNNKKEAKTYLSDYKVNLVTTNYALWRSI